MGRDEFATASFGYGDSRKTRSHHVIRRLGAHFEGTLRHFRLAADGSIADIDYFSITPAEKGQIIAGLCVRVRTVFSLGGEFVFNGADERWQILWPPRSN